MDRDIRTWRERCKAWWGRRSRVGKIALVLLAAIFVCFLGEMAAPARDLSKALMALCWLALTPFLLILLYRWFVRRVLWKVRNRLILTYLLIGLAPVVMFATLAGMTAYMLAGQYSTDEGLERLHQALRRVRDQAASAIIYGAQGGAPPVERTAGRAANRGTGNSDDTSGLSDVTVAVNEDATPLSLMRLEGGRWTPLGPVDQQPGLLTSGPPPEWLQQEFQKHWWFRGIVEDHGLLYLCAEVRVPRDGKTVVALASRPLTRAELDVMAKGLGRIVLSQGFTRLAADEDEDTNHDAVKRLHRANHVHVNMVGPLAIEQDLSFAEVSSTPLRSVAHPYLDLPVLFSSGLPVTSWRTGKPVPAMLAVFSRPSYLYALLFASSVTNEKVVRTVLIAVAAFFALLEMFALAMATSLSWTITRSVAELYEGTREIDAGRLEHRIPVRRKDQLAALATSFNGMAASVSELLVQQREKEHLLNELAIAQEVQTTLFPQSPAVMGALEAHGVCLPARTIGGDYFDFIFGYGPGYGLERGPERGPEGGSGGYVMLALGDISGKGISAALLMSGLHSADRAFSAAMGLEAGVPPSPAALLKLLNAHLFQSTQSARYATLFLAAYDPATRRLTYSNGGHLPPVIFAKDGSVRRLEVGGPVVGLLEGLEYEEATVQLEPGDLLVAYTDGLTEPERNGEEFGAQRLIEYLRAHRMEPLTLLAESTLQTVKTWIGDQEQPDDMTIILARQGDVKAGNRK